MLEKDSFRSSQVKKGFIHIKVLFLLDQGVYNYGDGFSGNFGNGSHASFKTPTENKFLNHFLSHNHLKVVKAKTSGKSTVIQLSNFVDFSKINADFIEKAMDNYTDSDTIMTDNWGLEKTWGL